MNKIICDICGTSYPDSSECCPICGCTNTDSSEILGNEVQYEDFFEEKEEKTEQVSGNNRKKAIFDFDEVNEARNFEENEEDEGEEEDNNASEEEDAPRHNTFVVILLTILIVALLGVAGFIFVRYFLPNMDAEETVPTTVSVQETETVAPSTEPTIPCQQMAMTNAGVAELNAEGQQFLLHIKAIPEETTDKIIYTSGDESIATVTEDGKITAISEGETIIYISCGKHSIECPVIVKYVEETVPPSTAATVEETTPVETTPVEETLSDDETEPVDETVADDETSPTEEVTATEDSSDNEENSELKDVVLKLKRTDIQLGVYYQFQLVLDCDLDPEEVTWTSEHPHIATVDEKGNVTAVKEGTTEITAQYGDQEVQCMVRCIWY